MADETYAIEAQIAELMQLKDDIKQLVDKRKAMQAVDGAQALAIALGPNLIEAYYELGRAHWLNDELDQAREVWQRGHTMNTFGPWGEKCVATLALVDAGGELPRS